MSYARLKVKVSGRVQGVCYRMETKRKAEALGIKGWVKNSTDGNVEALFEGEEKAVSLMIEWCRSGPPHARVDHVDAGKEPFSGSELSFEIKY